VSAITEGFPCGFGMSLRGPTRSGASRRGRRSNLNAESTRLLRFARHDRMNPSTPRRLIAHRAGGTTRKWQWTGVARSNSFDRGRCDGSGGSGRHAQAALGRATRATEELPWHNLVPRPGARPEAGARCAFSILLLAQSEKSRGSGGRAPDNHSNVPGPDGLENPGTMRLCVWYDRRVVPCSATRDRAPAVEKSGLAPPRAGPPDHAKSRPIGRRREVPAGRGRPGRQ
jgi:hypothetical protein